MAVEERELWACGQHLLATKGDGADAFVADRIADFATRGDERGVRTWRAIADRMDRLRLTGPLSGLVH